MLTMLVDWWECRSRLRELEAELARAGVHRRDPMFPLIREMAAIPDRLLRLALLWLLINGLILLGLML